MTTATTTTGPVVNGLDLGALAQTVQQIEKDPKNAQVSFRVATAWRGRTRTETQVSSWRIAGEERPRRFTIVTDEPEELLGANAAPNPQETLMAAVNACMTVGWAANAALRGITIESLEIACEGDLDLRGFLALADVPPGYTELRYTVRIRCDGTREQLEEIHEAVRKTSPNVFHLTQPVRLEGTLEVL